MTFNYNKCPVFWRRWLWYWPLSGGCWS